MSDSAYAGGGQVKASPEDFDLLRAKWKNLREYDGQWIAFHNDVLGFSFDLDTLLDRYSDEIKSGTAPLFAFVTFDIFA